MSIPAYLWLTDENDSPIIGGSLVLGREGAIELNSVTHNICIPIDSHTGKLTGTRVHAPITVQKEFDQTTPLLYRALSQGRILKSATLKMYHILDTGKEGEYFNIIMNNVKITAITPHLFPSGMTSTHLEEIQFRYESITWKHCEGNILFQDSWNQRHVA